jgi:drug/metabolite transporter (DMT)-like permease
MSGPTFLWLMAAMAVFLSAASALRAYVDNGALWAILLSLGLYCVGNLMMVRLMRESGMAVAISVSAVLQLVMATLIAVAFFGERPTGLQWAGIGLGVMAVAMVAWPTGGRT